MKKIDLEGFLEATKESNIYGVIVKQNGVIVGEYHYGKEMVRPQYSATKSFTSTAVGIAIDEGIISLEDQVISFFDEEVPENPGERLKALKIKHLLKMAMGHGAGYLMADSSWGTTPREEVEEKNWVKYCFERPMPYNPGDKFVYDNSCAYILGVIVQKVTGETLVDYLMPRLFEPLGIEKPTWEVCPMGYNFGAGGIFLKISDLCKLGELYLNKGNWNGRQIVSEKWVKEASIKHIDTDSKGDWCRGYGYQFWRGKHDSYRADGKYGQYSIVIEDKKAVIAINAHAEKVRRIMEAVWSEIWPQL